MNVEAIYSQSFYDKLDGNNYVNMFMDIIEESTNEANERCQSECPVDTGLLRDSHEVDVGGLTGSVTNSTDYWVYVVYGTYKMSANDYPLRVVNSMISEDYFMRVTSEVLRGNGII